MSSSRILWGGELKEGDPGNRNPLVVARATLNVRRSLAAALSVVVLLFLFYQVSRPPVTLSIEATSIEGLASTNINSLIEQARKQEGDSLPPVVKQVQLDEEAEYMVAQNQPPPPLSDTPTPPAVETPETHGTASAIPSSQTPAETRLEPTSAHQFANSTTEPSEVPVKPFVNIVFAFRDRLPRLVNLLSRLERISTDYGDTRFRVIVSDYDSPLKTVEATRYILNSWAHETGIEVKYVNVPIPKPQDPSKGVTFNKALTIVHGVNLVTNADDIVFICDVDMYLPLNIFDAVRENCEKGVRFYAPVCFSLSQPADGMDQYLGAGERRTPGRKTDAAQIEKASLGKDSNERQPGRGLGFWRHSGYGNVALYKYDWNRVGDVVGQFINQSKWGHEDLHIFGELNAKLKAERNELRGFYHLWHPRAEWQVDNGEHKGVL